MTANDETHNRIDLHQNQRTWTTKARTENASAWLLRTSLGTVKTHGAFELRLEAGGTTEGEGVSPRTTVPGIAGLGRETSVGRCTHGFDSCAAHYPAEAEGDDPGPIGTVDWRGRPGVPVHEIETETVGLFRRRKDK